MIVQWVSLYCVSPLLKHRSQVEFSHYKLRRVRENHTAMDIFAFSKRDHKAELTTIEEC